MCEVSLQGWCDVGGEVVVRQRGECVHFEDVVGDHESERLSRGESSAEFGVINLELACQWQKDVVPDSFALASTLHRRISASVNR
jgi:hypothetical protein